VHMQCGYMLSRDSLVSGAHRVLVRGGDILNSGMVQHVEYNVHRISAHAYKNCATGNSERTKTVHGGYWYATQK
jgi:hypothetical protein